MIGPLHLKIVTRPQAWPARPQAWWAEPLAWLAGRLVGLGGPQAWLAGPQAWLDSPEGDERKDKQTEILQILQDFVPYA